MEGRQIRLAGVILLSSNPLQIPCCRRTAKMFINLLKYNRYGFIITIAEAINFLLINKDLPAIFSGGMGFGT